MDPRRWRKSHASLRVHHHGHRPLPPMSGENGQGQSPIRNRMVAGMSRGRRVGADRKLGKSVMFVRDLLVGVRLSRQTDNHSQKSSLASV